MRRAVGLLLILAFLVAVLGVVDVLVKDGVQSAVADRIETRSPGSSAHVHITSFPFVGRLAVSGDVPRLAVSVTDLQAAGVTFARIDLDVDQLHVDRHQLINGALEVTSIGSAVATATISQAEVDSLLHVDLQLGSGQVSYDGLSVDPVLSVDGQELHVGVHGLPALSLRVPVLEVLPCIGAVSVVPGALTLRCSFHQVPGLLAGHSFSA